MDRTLLEQGRAFQQRLLKLERRVRFLQRRVRYPGAVQTCVIDDITDVTSPAVMIVGTCKLSAGRWLFLASASWEVLRADATGREGIDVFIGTVDDHGVFSGFANQSIRATWEVLPTGTSTHQQATVNWVEVFDEPTTVAMRVSVFPTSLTVTGDVTSMRFQAVPL